MARGAQGAIITRFDADYTGMEEGAKTVVNIISETGKKGSKANQAFTVSTRDVGGAVRDLGRAASQVDPLLGKLITTVGKNHALMSKLSGVITSVGGTLISALSSPVGIVIASVTALGAAVGGLIWYFSKSNVAVGLSKESLADYAKSIEKYKQAIESATITERLHGDAMKGTEMQMQAVIDKQDEVVKKYKELTGGREISAVIDKLEGVKGGKVTTPGGLTLSTGRTSSIEEIKKFNEILKDPTARNQLKDLEEEFKRLAKQIDILRAKAEDIQKKQSIVVGPQQSAADINRYLADQLRSAESYRGGAMTFGADFAVQSSIEGYAQLSSMLRQVADEKARQIELEKELATASRESAQQQMKDIQDKIAYAQQYDIATIQAQQLESSKVAFQEWGVSLQATSADLYEGIISTSNMVTQGIGDSIAQAIVYQQNFGQAMASLGKQVAASVISMLVNIAAQQLIYLAIGKALLAQETAAKLGAQMAIGSAAAMASVFASVPFPGNFAAAAAAGELAAGVIGLQATKSAGVGQALGASLAGLKQGGITLGEGVVHVHSNEIIAPRSDYEHLMGKGTRALPMLNIIEIDGRELARSTVEYLPGAIRRSGVRGF